MREPPSPWLSRRGALSVAAATLLSPPGPLVAVEPPPLASRLRSLRGLVAPLSELGVPSLPGELRYPEWMLGTWRVTNVLQSFSMPLGSAFVDDFTRLSAKEDIDNGEELEYLLRWVPAPESVAGDDPLCAAQDRAFNALQETAAFLGDEEVAVEGARYGAPPGAPHGLLELRLRDDDPGELGARGGGGARPSTSTEISLRVEWCRWELADRGGRQGRPAARGGGGASFVTDELLSQTVVTRAGSKRATRESTLLETITKFEERPPTPAAPARIVARNRIIQYLLPTGSARKPPSRDEATRAALAGSRAVAVFDYAWVLEPASDAERAASSSKQEQAPPPPPAARRRGDDDDGASSAAERETERRVVVGGVEALV